MQANTENAGIIKFVPFANIGVWSQESAKNAREVSRETQVSSVALAVFCPGVPLLSY